jgi:hypothetical protein
MPVIPAIRRLRQEDQEFKTNLSYVHRETILKKKNQRRIRRRSRQKRRRRRRKRRRKRKRNSKRRRKRMRKG